MLIVSLWTSLLGLTEPLFVPEYWSPLSLFDLAQRTGFDIESLIFSFGIGGIAVVLYEYIFKTRHKIIPQSAQHNLRHRYHLWAIISAYYFHFFVIDGRSEPYPFGCYCHDFRRFICLVLPARPQTKNDCKRFYFSYSLFFVFLNSYCYVPRLCGTGMEFESYFGNFNFWRAA